MLMLNKHFILNVEAVHAAALIFVCILFLCIALKQELDFFFLLNCLLLPFESPFWIKI